MLPLLVMKTEVAFVTIRVINRATSDFNLEVALTKKGVKFITVGQGSGDLKNGNICRINSFFKWHQVAFILLFTSQFTVLINLRQFRVIHRIDAVNSITIFFENQFNSIILCAFDTTLRVLNT